MKGSQIDIICDLGSAYTGVSIYKSDTSNTAGASALTTCTANSCLPAADHTFNQTATSVTITISVLTRNRDEKWWTCINKNGDDAQFKLTVFSEFCNIKNTQII